MSLMNSWVTDVLTVLSSPLILIRQRSFRVRQPQ